MNKLVVIILLVYSNHVIGDGIEDQKGKVYKGIRNDDGYSQSWINPKEGVNWLADRGQRYPGIWIGSDKNGQGRYDSDDKYGQIGNYFDENERYEPNDFNDNYDDRRFNNRYEQGIRIGVNGYVDNRFNGFDRQDRNGRDQNLRTQLLLNTGLRGGLGSNAALRARLALNADLRARLGLNPGLSLGDAAGLTLAAGLRVGLDLSLGGDIMVEQDELVGTKALFHGWGQAAAEVYHHIELLHSHNPVRNVYGFRGLSLPYGHQDQKEDIFRPCQTEDYQCIRKLFAENSQCNPSYGPAPDPLYLDQNTLFLPYANMSYTLTNLKITGMANAKISDLYINRVTGNVVLSIQIKNLNQTSPRAYLSYKRVGKEPIILADASTILFSSLTLTAVLPRIPNLRLDLADINAYIDDGAPEYKLGPAAYTNKDPDVTAAFLQLSANLGLVIREGFLLQAQLLAALFIQLNICDFGVNLISV